MALAFAQFQKVKSRPSSARYGRLAFVAAVALIVSATHAFSLTSSGPIVISGKNGTVISGLSITSTSGPCVQIINSTNITIKGSNIGPCGTNNSTSNSWGIYVSGGSGINIYDSYIHVEKLASICGNSHDGVFITGASQVAIQGNVIAYNERNIQVWNASNIKVVGNFLLNPRGAATCSNPDNLGGPQFQAWTPNTPNQNITVSNNYILNSANATLYKYPGKVSDSLSFGVTTGIVAQNNYIVGGQYARGCGIVADHAANNAQVSGNIISNPYNCGIGLAGGSGHMVTNNKVLNLPPTAPPATGIVINGSRCPVSITGNIASAFQPSGWNGAYWSSGSCPTPTLSGNIFDTGCTLPNCSAYKILYPMATTNPPPRIPPQPYGCVAPSPYSTQTGKPSCP